MTDRHLDPLLNVRPRAEVLAAAQKAVAERSIEMRALVDAALAEFAADPDGVLLRLAPHWPPPRKRGRRTKAEIEQARGEDVT